MLEKNICQVCFVNPLVLLGARVDDVPREPVPPRQPPLHPVLQAGHVQQAALPNVPKGKTFKLLCRFTL